MGDTRKDRSRKRRERNRARAAAREHERVRARPIFPGTRVKITRRCHERRLYLTPAGAPGSGFTPEESENFFGYVFGRSLRKYGLLFHGSTQMGNHHHTDVTDTRGNRPNFKNSVHSVITRALNAKLGRFDSMWSRDGSCDTETPSDEETLRDLAYTDCNAVTSGLVKWGHLWPGFTTYGWRFGETRTFHRPDWFFDEDNADNSDVITITRVRPPGIFPELTDDELFDKLMELCREVQLDKQAKMRGANRRFMGVKKLLRSKWWDRAKSWEDRYKEKPKVASGDKWRRIAGLQRNRDWEREYAVARDERKQGLDPEFPAGTYYARLHYGVRVATGPPKQPT